MTAEPAETLYIYDTHGRCVGTGEFIPTQSPAVWPLYVPPICDHMWIETRKLCDPYTVRRCGTCGTKEAVVTIELDLSGFEPAPPPCRAWVNGGDHAHCWPQPCPKEDA